MEIFLHFLALLFPTRGAVVFAAKMGYFGARGILVPAVSPWVLVVVTVVITRCYIPWQKQQFSLLEQIWGFFALYAHFYPKYADSRILYGHFFSTYGDIFPFISSFYLKERSLLPFLASFPVWSSPSSSPFSPKYSEILHFLANLALIMGTLLPFMARFATTLGKILPFPLSLPQIWPCLFMDNLALNTWAFRSL